MVITRKYYIYYSWPPATRNKCNIFLVMTITTCDILRSFFTAIKDSPNQFHEKKFAIFFNQTSVLKLIVNTNNVSELIRWRKIRWRLFFYLIKYLFLYFTSFFTSFFCTFLFEIFYSDTIENKKYEFFPQNMVKHIHRGEKKNV